MLSVFGILSALSICLNFIFFASDENNLLVDHLEENIIFQRLLIIKLYGI